MNFSWKPVWTRHLLKVLALGLGLIAGVGCTGLKSGEGNGSEKSYAIYGEYGKDRNVLMKAGLNRRIFNTAEAQHGADIRLGRDGTITLQPGTYRITGFSSVTMQSGFAPPAPRYYLNYPGYGLVYPKEFEANDPLHHAIGIGSAGSALDSSPSLFDLVFTCRKPTQICVGHQSGEDLHDEVYLSVYDVDGMKSPFHVFARIAIFEM